MKRIGNSLSAGLAALIMSPAVALADGGENWGGHMHGGWFLGPFMMVLMLIVLVVAVVIVLRFLGWNSSEAGTGKSSSALEILEERFARGEIDSDEFQERKRTLGV